MKYRIKQKGKKYILQYRILFLFWRTVTHCVYGGMYPIFVPTYYESKEDAEAAYKLWEAKI